jgi:hypothetical protein
MTVARKEHTATPLPNGQVLIAGGAYWDSTMDYAYLTLASAELYE